MLFYLVDRFQIGFHCSGQISESLSQSDEDLRSWSQVWVETPGREAIKAQWEAADTHSGHFRYGLVPVTGDDLDGLESDDDVGKAAALINLHEQMLDGGEPPPEQGP